MRERNRIQHPLANHVEEQRAAADAERQGENNQYDDARGLSQHADAVAQVLQQGLHRSITPLCAFRTIRVDAISAKGISRLRTTGNAMQMACFQRRRR